MSSTNDTVNENVLEWIRGEKMISVTLCSGNKFRNRVVKLAKERPGEVEIIKENADGSIFAHIPLSYLHIYPPTVREYTEEEKAEMADRLRKLKEEKNG